jgi:hypothetical protein
MIPISMIADGGRFVNEKRPREEGPRPGVGSGKNAPGERREKNENHSQIEYLFA